MVLLLNCERGATDTIGTFKLYVLICRLEENKEPTRIFSSDMVAQADETQEPELEQPDKLIISSPVTSVAEPVLTPLGTSYIIFMLI